MTTVRTIGYQEKAPKTRSSGRAKSSVVRPPPRTHVSGVRRGRRRTRADSPRVVDTVSLVVFPGDTSTTLMEPPDRSERRRGSVRSPPRVRVGPLRSATDQILRGAVRLLQHLPDVRVPVGQDSLHHGVERVVDALR